MMYLGVLYQYCCAVPPILTQFIALVGKPILPSLAHKFVIARALTPAATACGPVLLLFAETVEPHDFAAAALFLGRRLCRRSMGGGRIDLFDRCRGWRRSGCLGRLAWLLGRLLVEGLELEAELHRRIEERRHRVERHRQALRNTAKRQADL